jgi:hypothetical protein
MVTGQAKRKMSEISIDKRDSGKLKHDAQSPQVQVDLPEKFNQS